MPKYVLSPRVIAQIETDFTYHKPQGDQQERYVAIRDKAREFAYLIAELTPAGRDQSLALTHLKLANMLANSAIACEV